MASSLRTRKAPLDLARKIPLMRDASNVSFVDADEPMMNQDSSSSSSSSSGFGASGGGGGGGGAGGRRVFELPIPATTEVEGYEEELRLRKASKFEQPLGYVRRSTRALLAEQDAYVEYDYDGEDEAFLRAHARFGDHAEPSMRLPIETFERIIDLFEKISGERAISLAASSSMQLPAGLHAPEGVIQVSEADHLIADSLRASASAAATAAASATLAAAVAFQQKRSGDAAASSIDAATSTSSSTLPSTAPSPLPSHFTLSPPVSAHVVFPPASRRAFPLPPSLAPGTPGFSKLIIDMHAYWLAKRLRLRKPLLRRFWPLTNDADQNPHHTFRAHERQGYKLRRTRKNDVEAFKKMQFLKRDIDAAMELLDRVRERESAKRDLSLIRDDIFEQALYELTDTTGVKRKPHTIDANKLRKSLVPKLKLKVSLKSSSSAGGAENVDSSGAVGSTAAVGGASKKGGSATATTKVSSQGGKKATPSGQAAGATTKTSTTTGGVKRPLAPSTSTSGSAAQSTNDAGLPLTAAQASQQIQQAALVRPAHAQYPGFKLGGWTPLSSLSRDGSFVHVEESAFEPEDPLDLAKALGMRLGVHVPLLSRQASSRPFPPFDHLPSGSQLFPVDRGYVMPSDPDVFFADICVQRRMQVFRASYGIHGGATSWEEGYATGLSSGIGGALSVDGSGWQLLGTRIESTILPLDNDREVGGLFDEDEEFFSLHPSKIRRTDEMSDTSSSSSSALGSSSSSAVASSKDSKASQGSLAVRTKLEGVKRAYELQERLSRMQEVASTKVSSSSYSSTSSSSSSGHGTNTESSKHPFFSQNIVLRPRLGRNGRLFIDRVRRPRPNTRTDLVATLADQSNTLKRRFSVVKDLRATLLQQWGGGFSDSNKDGDDDSNTASAISELATAAPGAFTLPSVYRYAKKKTSRLIHLHSRESKEVTQFPAVAQRRSAGLTTAFSLLPISEHQLSVISSTSGTSTASASAAAAALLTPSERNKRVASKLLSPELDSLLFSGIPGQFQPLSSSSSSSSSSLTRAAASSSLSSDPVNMALSYVLRFSSGIDANLSAVTKNVGRRSSNWPLPNVSEARWTELWGEADSEGESVVLKPLAKEPAAWSLAPRLAKVPCTVLETLS